MAKFCIDDIDAATYRKIVEIALATGKPLHQVAREALKRGVEAERPKRQHVNKYARKKKSKH